MNDKALSGVGIDHRQAPEALAVEQGVRNEVHGPDLVRAPCQGPFHPTRRHHVAPWTLRTQVLTFLTAKPTHAFVAHRPAFPTQQDMEPSIAVPNTLARSRMM